MNKFLLIRICWSVMLLVAAAVRAPGAVCTWNGAWDTAPSSAADAIVIAGGGNLEWSDALPATVASWTQQASYTGTVVVHTVYGDTGFTNFTVTGNALIAGGILAHRTNGTVEAHRLFMTVQGNLTVASGGAIGMESLGYATTYGPGGRPLYDGNGAAHGGCGGSGTSAGSTNVYGSIFAPENLGSGGGTGGSIGGGAIRLIVGGTLTNNGMITASTRTASYSGAGGSVFITAGAISGATTAGVIRANGTPNGSSYSGGGGGRVAVILTKPGADFTDYAGRAQAYGGWVGSRSGAAGTVYLETPAQGAGRGTLIIDNAGGYNLSSGFVVTLMPNGTDLSVFDEIIIRNNGILGVTSGSILDFSSAAIDAQSKTAANIAIHAGDAAVFPDPFTIGSYNLILYTPLTISGDWRVGSTGCLSHRTGLKLELALDGNLTVEAGGDINVDARGGSGGPGAGTTSGYGGLGGDPAGMGKTYGSITNPTDLGSGGGGGAIILAISGALTNNGTITAMGGGKASGGTVNLTVGTIASAASGIIRATGGGGDNGASGGGGRVAIKLTDPGADLAAYAGAIQCFGGHSYYPRRGAAGTIYFAAPDHHDGSGMVLVDNNNQINSNIAEIVTSLPAFPESEEDIRRTRWLVQKQGKIGLTTNATVWSVDIKTNSFLELSGKTLTVCSLTITNHEFRPGIYTAAALGDWVIDSSGSNGSVRVLTPGTVLRMW